MATNRDGHPWGFLASVNDLFKTAQADKPDDILAAVHPDALGGGFTYTSIHELSHFLGLAHPHDTIGKWVNPSTGKEEYWDGFTWTFDTTAASTTYAYDELKYSILDQETIARGHTAYYLTWTDESLAFGWRGVLRPRDQDAEQAAGQGQGAAGDGALGLGAGQDPGVEVRLRQRGVLGADGVPCRCGLPRHGPEPAARHHRAAEGHEGNDRAGRGRLPVRQVLIKSS